MFHFLAPWLDPEIPWILADFFPNPEIPWIYTHLFRFHISFNGGVEVHTLFPYTTLFRSPRSPPGWVVFSWFFPRHPKAQKLCKRYNKPAHQHNAAVLLRFFVFLALHFRKSFFPFFGTLTESWNSMDFSSFSRIPRSPLGGWYFHDFFHVTLRLKNCANGITNLRINIMQPFYYGFSCS